MNSIEIPQRGIHCIVERLLPGIGKHIGDQPLFCVCCKGGKDLPGILEAPGAESQSRQGDHGIPPPVIKPGVAGNDRLFPCGGPLYNKVICGKDKLLNEIITVARQVKERITALFFIICQHFIITTGNFTCGKNNREFLRCLGIQCEIARDEMVFIARKPTVFFHIVVHPLIPGW